MPLEEFWHGDIRLLEAYRIAYIRDKHYTAWVNGSYNTVAIATSFSEKPKPYPSFVDPVKEDKNDDYSVSRDNIEEVFRQQQQQQNSWFNEIFCK